MKRGGLALIAAVTLAAPALASFQPGIGWGPQETAYVRPGALLEVSDPTLQPASPDGCTLGFLLERNGTPSHALGAGHCHRQVGQEVRVLVNGVSRRIGTVSYTQGDPTAGPEYALIELDAGILPYANPTVYFFGGPTRLATPADLTPGKQVGLYGQGIAVDGVEKRVRNGPLLAASTDGWEAADFVTYAGDSGGPVVTHVNGGYAAVAIHYGVPWGATGYAPTQQPGDPTPNQAGYLVSAILADVKVQRGLVLELALAE